MSWSIFSSTPNKHNANSSKTHKSQVLHRTDINQDNEDLVDVAIEELAQRGHRITGVLRVQQIQNQNDNQGDRQRTDRRSSSSGNQNGSNRSGSRRR